MSPTSSINTEENWVLLQSRYDYIALPVSLAMDVMKAMKLMSKSGNKIEVASGEVGISIVSGEQMAVALVKSKLIPPEGKEE